MSKDQRVVDAEFEVISGPDPIPDERPFKERFQAGIGWLKWVVWALWAFAGLAMVIGEGHWR